MARIGTATALVVALLVLAQPAAAQTEEVVVLVLDAGSVRVNAEAVGRAIATAIARPVVRMTDERAQTATARLTIAFSTPDRWVLRYESQGQVAWVSDRIARPGVLRARLAELSQGLVERVGASPAAQRREAWSEDVILALQNEIVDPFADQPALPRARPISVLWSEVVDPFRGDAPRAQPREVWSEVLDPWAQPVRRR
jgi:hypothetical protein